MTDLFMNPKPAGKPGGVRPSGVAAMGLLLSVLPFLVSSHVSAQTPSLGTAAAFAVLGGSTVTNTGLSIITGAVGVAPGGSITGFPPGVVNGGIHAGGPVATEAQSHVTITYNALAGTPCNTNMDGMDLGGRTLTPAVYCYTSSAQLTGILTLDALGSSTAVFIFKIGSTLTTASASMVRLINGANPCNVFWQIGSSATLGTNSAFVGNVLALASITMTNGVSLSGRALARTGAVTMDRNQVTVPRSAMAAWINYGIGWPGTAGVPSLVLSARPMIGTTPNIVVQNVRGQTTFACLMLGITGPVSIPTAYGGNLLVRSYVEFGTPPVPLGSLAIGFPIPLDPRLVCRTVEAQVVQYDEGASHGVAFTRGLQMTIGL